MRRNNFEFVANLATECTCVMMVNLLTGILTFKYHHGAINKQNINILEKVQRRFTKIAPQFKSMIYSQRLV